MNVICRVRRLAGYDPKKPWDERPLLAESRLSQRILLAQYEYSTTAFAAREMLFDDRPVRGGIDIINRLEGRELWCFKRHDPRTESVSV